MVDAETVLDVLERHFQEIEPGLESQWPEFSRKVGDLADRFKTIASDDKPEAATQALESAVNKLLTICWSYPHVAGLLDQAEKDSSEPELESGGNRRPPPSASPDIVKVKEIANRYCDLLAKLMETTDRTKDDIEDRRTHP